MIRGGEIARFLGSLLGKFNDRLDDRLEVAMTKHHCAEHDFFGQFLGFRFNHHHGVVGAGDNEVEAGAGHLVDRRVEHVFVVDEADTGCANRTHERNAGERQRGGSRNHRQNVRVVFHVMGVGGHDQLGVAAIAVGKQRTNRAIDQTRDQRFLFAWTAFALEVTAGNAAGGKSLFLVVAGQRKEIDAFLRGLCGNDGGEDSGLAVGRHHGAVGLTCDLAGLKNELAPTPIEFHAMNIKHFCFLSRFGWLRMP